MNKNILILFLLLLFLSSCYAPVAVRHVAKYPKLLDNKRVRVKGEVVSSVELEDLRIFYVKGKIGRKKIAVVTNGSFPLTGEHAIVKGKVKKDFTHHGKYKMPVIYETKELPKFSLDNAPKKAKGYKYLNRKDIKGDIYEAN